MRSNKGKTEYNTKVECAAGALCGATLLTLAIATFYFFVLWVVVCGASKCCPHKVLFVAVVLLFCLSIVRLHKIKKQQRQLKPTAAQAVRRSH